MPNLKHQLYETPNGQGGVESFLITIIDSTGSMWQEHGILREVHSEIFHTYKKHQEFYMTKECTEYPKPMDRSQGGNITNAFQVVFAKIENNPEKYGKNITLLFISDGREEFTPKIIEPIIEKLKKKIDFQFICIEVGDQFPAETSCFLKSAIHNINQKELIVLKIDRREIDEKQKKYLRETFAKAFEKIKTQTSRFSEKLEANCPVQETLQGKLTFTIRANQVVMSQEQDVYANGIKLKHVQDPEKAVNFFQNSMLSVLEQKSSQKDFVEASEIFNQMIDKYDQLLSKAKNHKINEIKSLINSLADGKLEWEGLNDAKKSSILRGIYDVNVRVDVIISQNQKAPSFNINYEEIKRNVNLQFLKPIYYHTLQVEIEMMIYFIDSKKAALMRSQHSKKFIEGQYNNFGQMDDLIYEIFDTNTKRIYKQEISIPEIRKGINKQNLEKKQKADLTENYIVLGFEDLKIQVYQGQNQQNPKMIENEKLVKKQFLNSLKKKIIEMEEDDDE